MGANDALLLHPRGQLSSGGKLRQVVDTEFTLTNGVKLTHTLSVTPSGYLLGKKEVSGSMSGVIPETGEERDYAAAVEQAKVMPFTYKSAANRRYQLQGVLTEFKLGLSIEDGIQFTCSFVGKLVPSS